MLPFLLVAVIIVRQLFQGFLRATSSLALTLSSTIAVFHAVSMSLLYLLQSRKTRLNHWRSHLMKSFRASRRAILISNLLAGCLELHGIWADHSILLLNGFCLRIFQNLYTRLSLEAQLSYKLIASLTIAAWLLLYAWTWFIIIFWLDFRGLPISSLLSIASSTMPIMLEQLS